VDVYHRQLVADLPSTSETTQIVDGGRWEIVAVNLFADSPSTNELVFGPVNRTVSGAAQINTNHSNTDSGVEDNDVDVEPARAAAVEKNKAMLQSTAATTTTSSLSSTTDDVPMQTPNGYFELCMCGKLTNADDMFPQYRCGAYLTFLILTCPCRRTRALGIGQIATRHSQIRVSIWRQC
jgi:hypothetical protein